LLVLVGDGEEGGLLTTGGCDTRTRGGVRAGGDVGLLSKGWGVEKASLIFTIFCFWFLHSSPTHDVKGQKCSRKTCDGKASSLWAC
jgi:hypothetical protein